MAQVGSNSAAAAAAAEPGAFKSAPSNLEMLRKHIQENFGPTLAPSLEVLLFRRGWLHCTVDEFYGNLQTHSSAIVAEFSRTLSEFQLLSGIEENLLKALYLTHGQSQAMFLVQAMRMFTVQERFEGLLHPAKLLKLVGLVQPNQQRPQSGMASQSPFGSATPQFNRVSSSSPLTTPTHAPLGAQPYRSTASAPTPQRSNSSGFEDAHPPFGHAFGEQPAHAASGQTPQQVQGRPMNSWNVQTPHNQLYQPTQLSPYPTSRPQHLLHGTAQDVHRYHDPLPFTLGTGISQQSADALMAGTILPQEEPSPRRGVPPPAPTALCVDEYDLTAPAGHQPAPPSVAPVGFTPTKAGPPIPSSNNAMNWADATEEDELARQRAARESARQEAELKAFLAQHDQSRLLEALRGYTLERLAALSPKQFEAELKMRVCSKAARQHLMELLHPDGVFPSEPPADTKSTPSSAAHVGPLKPSGSAAKAAVAPDVASTKALLSTLNVRTPEKEKRPTGDEKAARPAPSDGRRGRYDEEDEPSSRPGAERYERTRDRDREHRDRERDRERDRGKGRDERHGSRFDTRYHDEQEEEQDDRYGRGRVGGDNRDRKQQSDRDRERQDTGRRRRTAYDDEYYEEEERYYGRERDGSKAPRERTEAQAPYATKEIAPRKAESSAPKRATALPVEVPAPRHGRREAPTDREPAPLGPLRQRSVLVTLNGVRSITMDDLHHAMARLGTVVDEAFIGDDGAEFELSHHIDALPSMETVQVRTTNGNQRVVIESVHFKKANSSGGGAHTGRERRDKEQNFNQPCRYFLSKDGCNRGESCKYQHIDPNGEEGRRGANSRERSARNARGRRDYASDEKGTSEHAERQASTTAEGAAP